MKNTIIIVLLMTIASFALGQNQLIRKFATQSVHQRLVEEHPDLEIKVSEIEQSIESVAQQNGYISPKTIPIVFHVMVKKDLIDIDDIYAQLDALNEHFNHEQINSTYETYEKTGYHSLIPDSMKIQFCIAKKFTNRPTPEWGVNFSRSKPKTWLTNDAIKFAKSKGADAWDTKRYLNIWIGELENNVSGYAQMPGGPVETDGIVIDYRFFGVDENNESPFNQGKTLTHLVGNYLGLYDLWNDKAECVDDNVDDTPLHNLENSGCPTFRHISTCYKNLTVEMTMNFMDNTYDDCMYLFTNGQMARMHAVLSEKGPRKDLHNVFTMCSNIQSLQTLDRVFGSLNEGQMQEKDIQNTLDFGLENGLAKYLIFPNPTKHLVNLHLKGFNGPSYEIKVFDPTGKRIYRERLPVSSFDQFQLDCSQWSPGIYMIRIKTTKET
ncbi:MAG: zinc-dependent metalloprotease, partial [Bacteroidota bacterium]